MNQFKKARERVGLSIQEVAEKLKVTRQAVYYWEDGTYIPNNARLLMLSELYQTTVDNLLKGAEHEKENS